MSYHSLAACDNYERGLVLLARQRREFVKKHHLLMNWKYDGVSSFVSRTHYHCKVISSGEAYKQGRFSDHTIANITL